MKWLGLLLVATVVANASGVDLRVLSGAPIVDGGDVELEARWENGGGPNAGDYVGASCGPQANELDALFQVELPESPPFRVAFAKLPFLRCEYEFWYVENATKSRGASLRVENAESPASPKQVHLIYPGNAEGMTFVFVSGSSSPPVLQVGESKDELEKVAQGTSSRYDASDMCHGPANTTSQLYFRDPGWIHSITVNQSLQPLKTYFYRVGSEQENSWSSVLSFKAAPPISADHEKSGVRLVAYGDQDVGEAAHNVSFGTRKQIEDMNGNLVLHFGDLGYALGKHYIWDKWGTIVTESGADRVPYMVTGGNHELDRPSKFYDLSGEPGFTPLWWSNGRTASAGECGTPTWHRFVKHGPGNKFWYSFDFGNIHIVQFSSEHDFRQGSPQWKWLQHDLASVDRLKTPWVIVTMHRPMYSTQRCEELDFLTSLFLRKHLTPLFDKHRVDLVLVAHTHSYERTCPLRGGKCVQEEDGNKGVVHVTVGSAGASLEGCGYSPIYGRFSKAHANVWGYVTVDTFMENEMRVDFWLASNHTIWDSVILKTFPRNASNIDVRDF